MRSAVPPIEGTLRTVAERRQLVNFTNRVTLKFSESPQRALYGRNEFDDREGRCGPAGGGDTMSPPLTTSRIQDPPSACQLHHHVTEGPPRPLHGHTDCEHCRTDGCRATSPPPEPEGAANWQTAVVADA